MFTFESDIQFITLYTELIIINQLVNQNEEYLNSPENFVSDFLPFFCRRLSQCVGDEAYRAKDITSS